MTMLELTELAPAISVRPDDEAGRALAHSGTLEATPDLDQPGHWRVRTGSKVGVATVQPAAGEPITVRIKAKVPISRLLFLLGYARSPRGWRNEHVPVAAEQELLPAFSRLYALAADEALRQGLLSGYRTVEETSLVVRGRIRIGDQFRRQHGRLIPLETTHDEYTIDIAENQLLRAAGDALSRLPSDVRRTLLRLRLRFAGVTPIVRGDRLPGWQPSRLNARYYHALQLADIVLTGASIEHRAGDITVHGFLFVMRKLFEDFVTTALREALADAPGRSILQASEHLDEARAIRIIPDSVHYDGDGRPRAVADAKYKAERPQGFPDADLYQMLAYCTALGLPEGRLVYAK